MASSSGSQTAAPADASGVIPELAQPRRLTLDIGARQEARVPSAPVDVGLDHVQVAAPAGCEPEARRFFGELLGLSEVEKPELLRTRGGVWFALGSEQLHIGVESGFSPAKKAHPALRVSAMDLHRLAEALTAAGETVAWDEALPGIQRFYTSDPWGNRIELLASA